MIFGLLDVWLSGVGGAPVWRDGSNDWRGAGVGGIVWASLARISYAQRAGAGKAAHLELRYERAINSKTPKVAQVVPVA